MRPTDTRQKRFCVGLSHPPSAGYLSSFFGVVAWQAAAIKACLPASRTSMNHEQETRMNDNDNDKPYSVESFLKDVEFGTSNDGAVHYEDDIASAEDLMLDCIPEEERDLLFLAIDNYTTKFMKRAAPGLLVEIALRQDSWREQQELIKTTVLQVLNSSLSDGANILKQATPKFHEKMAERLNKTDVVPDTQGSSSSSSNGSAEEKEQEADKEDDEADELASAIAASLAVAYEEKAPSQQPPFFYERDRTVWNDFDKFCFDVNRPREHVQAFLSSERGLGVKSKIDERRRLVLEGTVAAEEIEEARDLYKVVYVNCSFSKCKSPSTDIKSDVYMDIKECRECGAAVSVPKADYVVRC